MPNKEIVIQMSGLADVVAVQLRNQGIHIPGHSTASLERTRRAIIQLGATGVLTAAQSPQIKGRFAKLVLQVIRLSRGQGAVSHVRITQVG